MKLLDAGAHTSFLDPEKHTLLHRAAENGKSPQVLRRLLAAGMEIDARNARGETPLMAAFKSPASAAETLQTLRCLLEAGADPRATDTSGQSVVRHAATAGALSSALIVQALVDAGALAGTSLRERSRLFRVAVQEASQLASRDEESRTRAAARAGSRKSDPLPEEEWGGLALLLPLLSPSVATRCLSLATHPPLRAFLSHRQLSTALASLPPEGDAPRTRPRL